MREKAKRTLAVSSNFLGPYLLPFQLLDICCTTELQLFIPNTSKTSKVSFLSACSNYDAKYSK